MKEVSLTKHRYSAWLAASGIETRSCKVSKLKKIFEGGAANNYLVEDISYTNIS